MLKDHLVDDCKVSNISDLIEIAPFVHQILHCQIYVFSGLNNKITFMHPEEFDESLRPIFLHNQDDQTNHVVYIRNLSWYFRFLKTRVCLVCKKSLKALYGGVHSCSKRSSCLACGRFITDPKKTPSCYFKPSFCFGYKADGIEKTKCKVCNLILTDQSCAKVHTKICGKNGKQGFICKQCNRYYRRNRTFKNTSCFAQLHKCGEKLCTTCMQYTDSNSHLCKLKETRFSPESKSLAFLTMEFLCNENK